MMENMKEPEYNFESQELIIEFWENLDKYIEMDTVLEEIDNTFPEYFVNNYKIYMKLFNEVAEYYHDYYKKEMAQNIDFTIKYSDAFKYIVQGLKDTYIQKKNIYSTDIDNIIYKMFYNKYKEHLEKNKHSNIVYILQQIKNGSIN